MIVRRTPKCSMCWVDLVQSRIRWYDLPGLLVLMRPYRCPCCLVRTWRSRLRWRSPERLVQ